MHQREGLPVPDANESFSLELDEKDDEDEEENEHCSTGHSMSNDPDFDHESWSEPHLIIQGELHDLVRDFELPNNKAELLVSRLQLWNFLAADVMVSKLCDRQQQFNTFFFMEDDLVACNNINGLMAVLNIAHDPCDWRLFIDSSKTSL